MTVRSPGRLRRASAPPPSAASARPTPTTPPDDPRRVVGSSAAPRLDWLDAARGAAVVAVVLLHLSIGHFYQLPHGDRFVVPVWDRINQVIGAVRMPLLFLVSGMLAAGKIRRGFRRGRSLEAGVSNAYLYVVWLCVYAVLGLLAGGQVPFTMTSWRNFVSQFVLPETPLWFIFALAIYIPVLTALRRVPAVLVVAATVALHLWAAMTYTVESPLWTRALTYAVFFAIGAHADTLLRAIARSPGWTLVAAVVTVVVFDRLTLQALMSVQRPDLRQAALTMALFTAGAVCAMGLSALLCRVAPYRRVGVWVGRRTLGIYILHIPVILAFDVLLTGPAAPLATLMRSTTALDYAYPAVMTAVVVAACVGIETALIRCGLGILFRLPRPLRALAQRVRMAP